MHVDGKIRQILEYLPSSHINLDLFGWVGLPIGTSLGEADRFDP